ncbi:DciA family protein [Bombella sp. TMW 2.2559]|uniref:DciA family protein n=1 Tax=Bombella dulcis TaxID=2967339 RepID=A0ABT3WF32_9PROT|nr:DciA family protein [Bombella dulcis]MCX5616412.1 DciA family protein [Bombella dulcis]
MADSTGMKKPARSSVSGQERKTDGRGWTERRRGRARMIGAFLPVLTKPIFRKKSPLYVRLLMEWDMLVGSALAEVSEPCRLRPGVLTIRCCGPAAVEMQYAAPRILANINTACGLHGEEALHYIKLVQDRPVQRRRSAPSKRPWKDAAPVPVSGIEDDGLKETLERLGGHIRAKRQGTKKARRF